jgi:hypothetical protein
MRRVTGQRATTLARGGFLGASPLRRGLRIRFRIAFPRGVICVRIHRLSFCSVRTRLCRRGGGHSASVDHIAQISGAQTKHVCVPVRTLVGVVFCGVCCAALRGLA